MAEAAKPQSLRLGVGRRPGRSSESDTETVALELVALAIHRKELSGTDAGLTPSLLCSSCTPDNC